MLYGIRANYSKKVAEGDRLQMIQNRQRAFAAIRKETRPRQLQRQGNRGLERVKLGLTIPPWTPLGWSI